MEKMLSNQQLLLRVVLARLSKMNHLLKRISKWILRKMKNLLVELLKIQMKKRKPLHRKRRHQL